jgi:hypothetical protein
MHFKRHLVDEISNLLRICINTRHFESIRWTLYWNKKRNLRPRKAKEKREIVDYSFDFIDGEFVNDPLVLGAAVWFNTLYYLSRRESRSDSFCISIGYVFASLHITFEAWNFEIMLPLKYYSFALYSFAFFTLSSRTSTNMYSVLHI